MTGTRFAAAARAAIRLPAMIHAAVVLAAIVVIVVPIAWPIVNEGSLYPVFLIALAVAIARWRLTELRARRVALACLLVFVALELVVVLNHSLEPYGDFATQWETAVRYARDGIGVPTRPQLQRALPFYTPLVRLFGDAHAVYLTANVVVTSLTSVLAVAIARRYFGWQAAAKTALLLVFAGEPYVANTLPTHDLLGAFGVVLFLFLHAELEVVLRARWRRRWRLPALTALGVAIGLVIAWTHWQRGTGIFCAAALAVSGVLGIPGRLPAAGLRAIVVGCALVVAGYTMTQLEHRQLIATPRANHSTAVEMNLFSFSSYDTNGRLDDKIRKHELARALGPETTARLARVMFAETVRTGLIAKYGNFLGRARNLLDLGRESRWYFRAERTTVRWLSVPVLFGLYHAVHESISPLFTAILLLVALAVIARGRLVFDPRLTPLWITLGFVFVMAALGESQGRYSYFLFFLAAIHAGARWAEVGGPASRGGPSGLSVALVVALVALAARLGFGLYDVRLANLDRAEITGVATVEQNLLTVESGVDPVVCVQTLEARAGSSTLRVVVRHGHRLRLWVDRRLAVAVDLVGAPRPRLVEVPGIAQGLHEIRLEIVPGVRPQPATTVAYLGFY